MERKTEYIDHLESFIKKEIPIFLQHIDTQKLSKLEFETIVMFCEHPRCVDNQNFEVSIDDNNLIYVINGRDITFNINIGNKYVSTITTIYKC